MSDTTTPTTANVTRSRSRLLVAAVAAAVLLVAGGSGAVFLSLRGGQESGTTIPPEAARLYQQAGARRTATDKTVEDIQSRLTRRNNDPTLLASLGLAYLQKARETADPSYYAKAETVLRQAQAAGNGADDALHGLGQLALARHQFAEALEFGRQAAAINPYRAAHYGVIGDALVELGRYEEAAQVFQKMVDTRPDLASYSRVSYMRELHGLTEGAIEAMQRAVNAGAGPAENIAYIRVQLGHLYFNSGHVDEAERTYNTTLSRLPNYAPALVGLGRVAEARGDLNAAIDLTKQAADAAPQPEYLITLGDLYTRAGRATEAARQYELVGVLEQVLVATGTDLDVEMSLFAADQGKTLEPALERARRGYERRPTIHAADALGWTLYRAGRFEEADRYATEALRLGTKDSLKLFHAGMIAKANGRTDDARRLLGQALALNPHFSVLHAEEAKQTLAALGGPLSQPANARVQP